MKTNSQTFYIEENYEHASKVVTKLGLFPLAISQAGSYLGYKRISFKDYLDQLDERFGMTALRKTAEFPEARGTESATILTTWEMSFKSLPHSAQELLLLCGFLANGDIMDKLFDLENGVRFDWMGQGKNVFLTYWQLVFNPR
jgi:hypothetical protein